MLQYKSITAKVGHGRKSGFTSRLFKVNIYMQYDRTAPNLNNLFVIVI